MFINDLYLKDFKNIREATLQFGKINLIIGETGQGKSAIFEALTFLMTNTLDEKIEEYVRWFQKEFKIFTKFHHVGKDFEYTIKAGKGTDRKLVIDFNDDSAFYKSDAVKELVTFIDPEITLYSNIAMQHKSTELLFEKPTPRLQKIKIISKIQKINEIVDKMKEDVKEIGKQIETCETEIKTLNGISFDYLPVPELLEINLDDTNNKLLFQETEKKIYDEELKNHEVYKEQLFQYNSTQKELLTQETKLKEILQVLENIGFEEIVEFDDTILVECEKTLHNFSLEMMSLRKDIESYNKIQNEKIDITTKLEERNKLISENQIKRLPRLTISQESIDGDKKQRIEIRDLLIKSKDKLKAIQNGECPTCGAKYITNFIDDLKSQISLLSEDFNRIDIAIKEAETSFKDYENIQRDNKIIQSRLDIWNKDITEFTTKLESYSNIIEPDKAKLSLLQKQQNELTIKKVELTQTKQKYNEILIKNKEKEKKVIELEKIKISIESKIEEYLKIQKPNDFIFLSQYDEKLYLQIKQLLSDYELRLNDKNKAEEFNDKIDKQKKDIVKKVSILEKQIFKYREDAAVIKETHILLDKDFSAHLVDLASTYIKQKMNDFFQKAYGEYLIDFRQVDRGIEFFYSENSNDWHPVSMLSGFEKQIFATSFRIALTHLQNLNFLVLDEIDSDASTTASLKLYKAVLNENFEQIFVISHCEDTKDFFNTLPEVKVFEIENGELK
jgi:DNA repair exonuclease SbcCD ATPase subunit